MENIVYGAAVLIGINIVLGLFLKLFYLIKYIIISISICFGILCLYLFENINQKTQLNLISRDSYQIAVTIEITYLIMLTLFGIWFYKRGKLDILKEIKIGILVSIILFTVFYFLIVNDVLHQYKQYKKDVELSKLQPQFFISDDFDGLNDKMNFGKYVPTIVKYKQINISPSKYEIQAILYYDEKTFKQLQNKLEVKDQINIDVDYEWFPEQVRHEIATWKFQPYSYRDKIFNTPNGRFTILENKLIINFKNY